MRVHLRGNPNTPGDVVSAGGISAVQGVPADFGLPPDAPQAIRRERLASWITDRKNPLFARVAVNRLWQAHFGSGLVETASDLGFNGGVPSHPDLLDWLASEFVDRGWSLKAMHRLIVTSAAYRQGSQLDRASMAKDSGDRLLWRKSPTRLEAEMVRDAMLAISGELDPTLASPTATSVSPPRPPSSSTSRPTPPNPGSTAGPSTGTGGGAVGAACSTPSTAPTHQQPLPDGP
jgi:hypothetical protein